MVTKVKTDREVGTVYMHLMEMEQRIKKTAKEEGREEGRIEGRAEGRAEEIIDSGLECKLSEEEILGRLQKKLNIKSDVAKKYLTAYNQSNHLV